MKSPRSIQLQKDALFNKWMPLIKERVAQSEKLLKQSTFAGKSVMIKIPKI